MRRDGVSPQVVSIQRQIQVIQTWGEEHQALVVVPGSNRDPLVGSPFSKQSLHHSLVETIPWEESVLPSTTSGFECAQLSG